MNEPNKGLSADTFLAIAKGMLSIEELLELGKIPDLTAEELNTIGLGLKTKGDLESAEKMFKESIERKITYGSPYGNLISTYAEKGEFDLCSDYYEKGVKNANIDLDFIYFHQGRVLFLQDRFYEAAKIALEGIEKCEPYEQLYMLVIKSFARYVMLYDENNPGIVTKDDALNIALNFANIAVSSFPNSEEIRRLYEDITDLYKDLSE